MSKSNTTANPTVRELEKLRARVTGLEVARRQAEEALRESEKKFSNIYEQAPIGIELYDEKGRLLDVNPACLQIFGVNDVSEVQGFNLFADPNITNEIREMLAQGDLPHLNLPLISNWSKNLAFTRHPDRDNVS